MIRTLGVLQDLSPPSAFGICGEDILGSIGGYPGRIFLVVQDLVPLVHLLERIVVGES